MKKTIASTLTFLLLSSTYSHAGTAPEPANNTFYGGIGTGISHTDISRRNTDENGLYLKAFTGIKLSSQWGIELGGLWFEDINTGGKDAVGEYDIEFGRYDIVVGPTLQFKPRWFVPIQLMAGASYSRLDMEVKESFYGLAAGGKTSAKDHVTGTWLSAGIVPFQLRNISGLVSIDYIKRPDFFEESTRPLSFRDIAISFRMKFY